MPGKIIPEKLKAGYNSNIFKPKIVSKGYSKYLLSKEGGRVIGVQKGRYANA